MAYVVCSFCGIPDGRRVAGTYRSDALICVECAESLCAVLHLETLQLDEIRRLGT